MLKQDAMGGWTRTHSPDEEALQRADGEARRPRLCPHRLRAAADDYSTLAGALSPAHPNVDEGDPVPKHGPT